MAANNISSLIADLSLRADERKTVKPAAPNPATNDVRLMLAEKILGHRKYPFERIAGVFEKIWSFQGTVSCSPLKENEVLFYFTSPLDKERVLERESWTFDRMEKHLVVLTEPREGTMSETLAFTKTPFWIHIHGVPFIHMTEENARIIGNEIGEFLEFEKDKHGRAIGDFMRIRVLLDITKPIKRVQALEMIGPDLETVVMYEKLPNYCTFCGVIGHDRADCVERLQSLPKEAADHHPFFTGMELTKFWVSWELRVMCGEQPRNYLQGCLYNPFGSP